MITTITYELYFSRRDGHPFLCMSTIVRDENWKVFHQHSATLDGTYEWERRELWNELRRFKAEPAHESHISYKEMDYFKTITVMKTWRG